jgi:hypothetical protein
MSRMVLRKMKSFVPFIEYDVNWTNQPVPYGTAGCWVTLFGPGAKGATGAVSKTTATGSSGGGGGARVGRSFIPVTALGSTYSVVRSVNYGVASTFICGAVTLRAGPASGTTGGVASGSGYAGITLANGAAAAGSSTIGAGAGGGRGSGIDTNGHATPPSQTGGSVSYGGVLQAAGGADSPAPYYYGGGGGHGGGGDGGYPGGGGGGGSAKAVSPGGAGGDASAGHTIIEWVDVAP